MRNQRTPSQPKATQPNQWKRRKKRFRRSTILAVFSFFFSGGWVGLALGFAKFAGFITFLCFPTQQSWVNRKSTILKVNTYTQSVWSAAVGYRMVLCFACRARPAGGSVISTNSRIPCSFFCFVLFCFCFWPRETYVRSNLLHRQRNWKEQQEHQHQHHDQHHDQHHHDQHHDQHRGQKQ